MATVRVTRQMDPDEAQRYAQPRTDFIGEVPPVAQPDGSFIFGLETGPFDHYERRVQILPEPGTSSVSVREETSFTLAIPGWSVLLSPALRWELRRNRPDHRFPWWAPPDRWDARTARIVSLLCIVTLISGYLGVLIGQTLTFAADEFDASKRIQGIVLATVRVGTLLTVVLTTLADRRGRKPLLTVAATIGITLTAAGAIVPNIWSLTFTQALARGAASAMGILIGVLAAEAVPKGSRAYTAGVLILTAGLGSGMPVWMLWVADTSTEGWRILFAIPLAGLPLVLWLHRRLPESERFIARARATSAPEAPIDWRRFSLIGAVSMLFSAFASPASQFRNDFLRDERNFSAARITPFTLLTNTPVGIGVAIAGKWADRRGRRRIGAFAVFGGALFTVLLYSVSGPGMWTASILASIIGAMAGPALGVYSAELFGTGARGRANGLLSLVGVTGSVVGLLFIGFMSDEIGYSRSFMLLAILPAIVIVLVLTKFPETAQTELEALNPDDTPT